MSIPMTCLRDQNLERKYAFSISLQELQGLVKGFIQSKASDVKIPGFRPGAAPMDMLFGRFVKEAVDYAVKKNVQALLPDMVKNDVLARPALYDVVSPTDFSSFDAMTSVDVEVTCVFQKPIEGLDFTGLKVDTYDFQPVPAVVQAELEADAHNSFHPVPLAEKRPAQKGDFLFYTMTYEGKEGAKPATGKIRLGYSSAMGIPKEFEEELVGINIGHSFSEKMKVPKDFPEKSLAGQKLSFVITFTDIQGAAPYEVNEDFAKAKGFNTLKELEEASAKHIQSVGETTAEVLARENARNALMGFASVEIAPSLVDNEWNALKSQSSILKAVHGKTLEERVQFFKDHVGRSEDDYVAFLKERALGLLRAHDVVGFVVREQGLKAENNEIFNYIQSIAKEQNEEVETVIKAVRDNTDFANAIVRNIKEMKALDWVLQQCQQQKHVVTTVVDLEKQVAMARSRDNGILSANLPKDAAKDVVKDAVKGPTNSQNDKGTKTDVLESV